MMMEALNGRLTGIVSLLKIPSDEISLEELKRKTLRALKSDVESLIADLERALKGISYNARFRNPFICLFLSHSYNLYSQRDDESLKQLVEQYAFDSQAGFNMNAGVIAEYNYALSLWYLGLVYWDNGNMKKCCIELRKAWNLLEILEEDALQDSRFDDLRIIRLRQKEIKPHLAESYQQYRPDIRMPWAVRILEGLSLPKREAYRARIDWAQFYPRTSEKRVRPVDGTMPPERTSPAISTKHHYISIPVLPIYGRVAASPTGAPILNNPEECANAVDEAEIIFIDGHKHKVHAVTAYDRIIALSKDDIRASFFSEEKVSEYGLKGRRYGWLKVSGNSMNDVSPTSINNNDYVLFYENRNSDACINKIVVASLPQETSLVVKRFIKTDDGRYLLRSQSRNKDPKTQRDYEDMEIIENNQLIGIVAAIAKPS